MMKYVAMMAVGMSLTLVGCTENIRARSFGGTMTINVAKGQKVVNATWKGTDLWILTKKMKDGEIAESYEFIEKSSFGVIQGKINIVEEK
jgi:hypothetical protein